MWEKHQSTTINNNLKILQNLKIIFIIFIHTLIFCMLLTEVYLGLDIIILKINFLESIGLESNRN